MAYTAAVITISDKGYRGEREDTSGPNLVAILKERGFAVKNAMAADLFPRCSHVESIVCLCKQ